VNDADSQAETYGRKQRKKIPRKTRKRELVIQKEAGVVVLSVSRQEVVEFFSVMTLRSQHWPAELREKLVEILPVLVVGRKFAVLPRHSVLAQPPISKTNWIEYHQLTSSKSSNFSRQFSQ